MGSAYCLSFQVQITTLGQSIHIEDFPDIFQYCLEKYETHLKLRYVKSNLHFFQSIIH
jgi:hypothetical protein